MTTEQQNAQRLAAWDDYQAAKMTYFACRAQLRKWGRLLFDVSAKLGDDLAKVIEQDYSLVPNHQLFASELKDFQIATRVFMRAREEATRFGFQVDPNDFTES